MTLSVTDLFCGAGGSSSGAELVPGVTVRMAVNHWKLAVETHNTNLPHADHDCADISQVDPRRYPATDLLWASPECTNHSQAKGRKRRADAQPDLFGDALPDPAADRSRATMWDVPRFVEAMALRGRPYRGFVVENVVDVRHWMFYDAWRIALRSAGYCLHEVWLNSMFAQAGGLPAPQSRDRWYCLGHLASSRCPDLDRWTRPAAWCARCDKPVRAVQSWKRPDRAPWGRYRQQYLFRCPTAGCHAVLEPAALPAATAIDWSLRGQRIGDRAKPLADKTLRRIEAGLRKYARPNTLEAAGHTFERRPGVRAWPADQPLTTQTTTATKALACPPLAVPVEGRDGASARPVGQPLRTQTARNQDGLAFPPMLVPAGGTWNDDARAVAEPMRTRTTRDADALVCPPFLALLRSDRARTLGVDEPLATVVSDGSNHALVQPFVAELRGGGSHARAVADPLATVTAAGNHHGLVTPPGLDTAEAVSGMVMRNNTARGNPAQMCTPLHEALRTITTAGRQSLVAWPWMVVDYNGHARRVSEPLPTQTTVEVAAPFAAAHGIELAELRRTRRDGSEETLFGRLTRPGSRSLPIPVRMSGGAPGTRSCTADFKIRVIGRELRRRGAAAADPATVGIGISVDEIGRANNRRAEPHERVVYPLLDLRVRRADCPGIIRAAGLPAPPKSACWFCPFHRVEARRRCAAPSRRCSPGRPSWRRCSTSGARRCAGTRCS